MRAALAFLALSAVLALALGGCAPAAKPMPPLALLEPCAAGVKPPPAPRPPRTAPVLARWSIQIQLAREATERARADCAERHDELVAWVRGR